MRSLFRPDAEFVSPIGAGASDGRWVIGSRIPPEITAYYLAASPPLDIIAVELTYSDIGSYIYAALGQTQDLSFTPYKVHGAVNSAGPTVSHFWSEDLSGVDFGDFGGAPVVNFAAASTLGVLGGFTVDGFQASRELQYTMGSAVDAGASGIIPASVLSGGGFTWKAGHAYRIDVGGMCSTSLGTNKLGMFIQDNTAKVILNLGWFGPANVALQYVQTSASGFVRNTTGANYTSTSLDMIAASSAGTAIWRGSTDAPRFVTIEDLGASSSLFPWAKNIG